MPDSKLIDLSAAATLTGAELVYGVQSGNDVKMTVSQIAALPGTTSLNKQVLYNRDGVIDGSDGLIYDNVNNRIGVGSASPQAKVDIQTNSMGNSPDSSSGIWMENMTAATASVQQVSPSIIFEGQGWASTPVQSQSVKFQEYMRSASGSATASGSMVWSVSQNNGAYTDVMTLGASGTLNVTALTSASSVTAVTFTSTATGASASFQSTNTFGNSNFATLGSGSTASTVTQLLFAGATSVGMRMVSRGSTQSGLTLGQSYSSFIIGQQGAVTAASGVHALAAQQVINPLLVTSGGASTLTNTASLYINGASSATVTGVNYMFWADGTGIDFSIDGAGNVTGQQSIAAVSVVINAKTVTNTLAFTPPTVAGKSFIVTEAVVRCTAASAITVGPTLGIGTVAGTNNIYPSTAIMGLTATNTVFGFSLIGMSVSVPGGTGIYVNLSVASTGTSQNIQIDFIGYYA